MALEADSSNLSIHPIYYLLEVFKARAVAYVLPIWLSSVRKDNGMSPSGKAKDFDSFIRGFESRHPSQIIAGFPVVIVCASTPQ